MSLIITPNQLIRRAELYHQLGQMLVAGIPLPKAIDLQQRHPPSRSFSPLLRQLGARLDDGMTFSGALDSSGTKMPKFDLALLQAGEKSGRLPDCLKLLASYYRERAQLTNAVLARLAYPTGIVHFALLIFPVSRLQSLVAQGDLAGYVTQKLVILLPLYLLVFLLAFAFQARRGEYWRAFIEQILHYIPVLGTARRSLALARLSTALEALLSAGVPIIQAWELSAAASGSPALHRVVQRAQPRLQTGETPAEMVSNSSEFPSTFANLYHTGEVSGQLDETLKRLGDLYQEEGSRRLRMFLAGATTVIVLGVMLTIAWQIVSFWMGYYGAIGNALGTP
jgi:type II secretory pathway component PulF